MLGGFWVLSLMGACAIAEVGEPEAATPSPTLVETATPRPTASAVPTTTPTEAPYVPKWPLVQRGDWGQPEVFALQRLLRHHGFILIADGKFGGQTLAAVQEFQTELGEPVDGLVGPVTWSALVEGVTLQQGDSSEAVKAAQYLLNKFRDPVKINGEFGATDVAALLVFRVSSGPAT